MSITTDIVKGTAKGVSTIPGVSILVSKADEGKGGLH